MSDRMWDVVTLVVAVVASVGAVVGLSGALASVSILLGAW